MSSTRERAATMSAMFCRSTRMAGTGRTASRGTAGSSSSVDATAFGRSVQEAAQRLFELGLVQQEGIVALVALDFHEADIGRDRVQRLHHRPALPRGKEPVTGEGEEAEAHRGAAEHIGQYAALLGRQIEIVHGSRDVEVGVGIEALDE